MQKSGSPAFTRPSAGARKTKSSLFVTWYNDVETDRKSRGKETKGGE